MPKPGGREELRINGERVTALVLASFFSFSKPNRLQPMMTGNQFEVRAWLKLVKIFACLHYLEDYNYEQYSEGLHPTDICPAGQIPLGTLTI